MPFFIGIDWQWLHIGIATFMMPFKINNKPIISAHDHLSQYWLANTTRPKTMNFAPWHFAHTPSQHVESILLTPPSVYEETSKTLFCAPPSVDSLLLLIEDLKTLLIFLQIQKTKHLKILNISSKIKLLCIGNISLYTVKSIKK